MPRQRNNSGNFQLGATLLGAAALVAVLLAKSIGKNPAPGNNQIPDSDREIPVPAKKRPARAPKSAASVPLHSSKSADLADGAPAAAPAVA